MTLKVEGLERFRGPVEVLSSLLRLPVEAKGCQRILLSREKLERRT
jgi:hypothetical protein